MSSQLWFTSGLFAIEPGEDSATNPGCFGKQLANWMRAKLIEKGYDVEEVILEDWGWCVMCARKPFLLWVGCGSATDDTWTCFVESEKPLVTALFTRIDPAAASKLFSEVKAILEAEPQIELIDEP